MRRENSGIIVTIAHCYMIYTRAALKIMPPNSLCWPAMSEADEGGVRVKAEPSHPYSVTLIAV